MDLGNEKTESTKEEKTFSKKFSRRGFLKTSVGMGVGAAGTALFGSEMLGSNGVANAADIVKHDAMPVEISSDYKRFEQKNAVLYRGMAGDPKVASYAMEYAGKRNGVIPQKGGEGWGPVEAALDRGAWAVEDIVNHGLASAGIASQGLFSWEGKVNPKVHQFESPEIASSTIKKVATFYGASLVGIAPYDERWVYSTIFDLATGASLPNKLAFEPKSVISLAFEMDYEGYQTAPALPQTASSATIYSNMGVTAAKIATFLRTLGYNVMPCSNDTGLSIPIAIQAGLGEISRAGIIITPEYGPRVRLCKIFTDLPLAYDKPITFGAMEFCKTCMKCADNCPSGAISKDVEPSFKVSNISTNPGVKKWAFDGEKCVKQWAAVGGDCGICIKVCPYNKKQEWHHDFVKLGTKTPARPILRFFDDLFGYGKISVEDATKNFWNK